MAAALNIAIALKRSALRKNALPVGHGVWADIIRNAMAKQDLHSAVEAETGDNGWCRRWWSLTVNGPGYVVQRRGESVAAALAGG